MRTVISSWGMILLSGIGLTGCLYYGPQATGIKTSDDLQRLGGLTHFQYVRDDDWPPLQESIDWGLYRVQAFHLPTSLRTDLKQKEYRLFYYRPKGQGPFPAVVVLPITRGDYYTQTFAIYLAERGYACLRFESTRNFTDDSYKTLASAELILKHYVIDVRRSIDWLTSRREVDPHRIGIIGISLGALVASVVMEADPRIQSGVLLLGGADLAGIIDTSEENSLMKFRKRAMDFENLEDHQFREVASRVLKPVDPLTYAHRLDPRKILMINGYFDRVIRREYVKALWEASGRPELVFIPTGHYSAGFFVPYARAKTLVHFKKSLR